MSLFNKNIILFNNIKRINLFNQFHSRSFLLNSNEQLSEGEQLIFNKLTQKLKPSELFVRDVSGGCGSMYAIKIKSSEFQGKNLVQQHRIVNETLKDEIAGMHGLQLDTSAE